MDPETPVPERVTIADLTEGKWRARFKALARLPVGEPVPAELHAALVGLLAAPKTDQRAEAVTVVVRVGPPAVPLLLALLADESAEADTRRAAVVALGRLGPAARPALPVLVELIDDPWLGPCARSAIVVIEPARRGGFLLLCAAIAIAALLAIAVTAKPTNGLGLIATAVSVVGGCVAIGLWWTRPGAVGAVLVFAVGIAVAVAIGATGGVSNVFAEVSHILARP